jgi:hypothetical protein
VSNVHNGTGLGTVSAFTDSGAGVLTGGVGAVDPGLSPDGRFLYVNESPAKSVGAFAVSGGGNLTELPGSPTPLPW